MVDTALREVREELGLIVTKNDVLAELPMMHTRTTGYRVFPYLARITVPDRWQIAEREIAEILDVKLGNLTRADAHDKMSGRFPNWHSSEEIPFYRIGVHRLWGLSYRILQPVIPRLVVGEWNV
jgi:8-oxo-dGTP pyrophosphatase MutT (NUDIX family)